MCFYYTVKTGSGARETLCLTRVSVRRGLAALLALLSLLCGFAPGGRGDNARLSRKGVLAAACKSLQTNPTFAYTQGLFQMVVISVTKVIPCLGSLLSHKCGL